MSSHYHQIAPASTPSSDWWVSQTPPRITRGLSERDHKLADRLSAKLIATESTLRTESLRRAFAHVVNAAGGLAAHREERGWVQVSISYVTDGAGVTRDTARHALQIFQKIVMCRRTSRGYLTTTREAVRASWKASVCLDVPEPLRGSCIPQEASLVITGSKLRGLTRCPCGEHNNGDRDPSLAYDLKTGLATCQVSRAVFKKADQGTWFMVRAPWGKPTKNQAIERTPNKIPPGGEKPWRRHAYTPGRGLCSTRTGGLVRMSDTASEFTASMKWAASHYGGQAEEERARVAAACHSTRPDRWICMDRVYLDHDATQWGQRASGQWFPKRAVYKSAGTDLVLLDLDGLAPRGTELEPEALRNILGIIREANDLEPVSVTTTSGCGLQIVCRIPEWAESSEDLHRYLPLRRTLQTTGERILAALGRGGTVDRSAWARMRNARRPGWRVKGGEAVLARLWWTA